MAWSTERALKVYSTVFPADRIRVEDNDPRQDSIVAEMNEVRFSPTAEKGAEAIDWWDWDTDWASIDAAKCIRRFKA